MDTRDPNPSLWATRRESGMVQRLRASLRRGWPADSIPHVLIGCSGGKDSVALAVLLQALVRTGDIHASMVHVDHRVRDDSADAAGLVQKLGHQLGMPVHTVVLQPGVTARHQGVGAEEALRRERYQAYADVGHENGADVIALAHHQQDQAETVLLHLIRGAGLQGASGMREWSRIHVPWWNVDALPASLSLWRPFLGEPSASIDAFHQTYDLPVSEDHTNEDRSYRRNAIRHDVLPELEAIFPGAIANLSRFADLAADDDRALEALAESRLDVQPNGGLHRRAIMDVNAAIQRRVIRMWILGEGFQGDLTSGRVEAVRQVAVRNRSGAVVDIGNEWAVSLAKGVLSLHR